MENKEVATMPKETTAQDQTSHQPELPFGGIGFSLGWLVGLSASPVLSGVLTSILGSVAALITVVPALGSDGKVGTALSAPKHTPRLLAVLVIFMAIGATVGTLVRTNNLLGSSEPKAIERQKDTSSDRDAGAAQPSPVRVSHRDGVLFSITSSQCADLTTRRGSLLRAAARASTNRGIAQIASELGDDVALERVIGAFCQAS